MSPTPPTPPTLNHGLADVPTSCLAIFARPLSPASYPGLLGSGLASNTGQDAGEATGMAEEGVVLISGPDATAGVLLISFWDGSESFV